MTKERMNVIVAGIEEKGIKASVKQVAKNNVKMYGISFEVGNICPVVYFTEQDEIKTDEEVIERIYNAGMIGIKETDERFNNVLDKMKLENVIGFVCSAEMNTERITECPHRIINDLCVMYKFSITENANIQITNEIANKLNFSEPELYDAALKNNSPIVKTMLDMLIGLDGGKAIEELKELDDLNMFVVTNENKCFGAFSITDMATLEKIAGQLESNLWILPSSIHEIIIIPESMGEYETLKGMIESINKSEVQADEILSDHPYFYDRISKNLR